MHINYIVYKTTNLINGKVYVGVHKMDLDNPDSYLGCGVTKKDKKWRVKVGFPAAVRKYGFKNFKREVLFAYPDTEEGSLAAYEKEAEIVNSEWVKSNANYNLTIGGKGGFSYTLSKPVNQYSCFGKYIKTWPSALEASRFFNCSPEKIRKICRNQKGICNDFQWRFYEGNTNDIEEFIFNYIYQYDLFGNLINVWKTISEASKLFPNPKSAKVQIGHVIHSKYKDTQAFGFYWNNKPKFEYKSPKDLTIPVACYTSTGVFIQDFPSLSAAAKFYNISIGNLSATLKGQHKTCKKLIWRYYYGDKSNITP